MIEISQALPSDVGAIKSFIDQDWIKGHILSTHRELFDWQYSGPSPESPYHWVIAKEGHTLLGILGYVPNSKFGSRPSAPPVLWLALWKIKDEVKKTGLGLRLLSYLSKLEPSSAIGVSGINPLHPPMYRALGYKTGQLNHHVLFNFKQPSRIAKIPDGFSERLGKPDATTAHLSPLKEDFKIPEHWINQNYKTIDYFKARYLKHPIYQYQVYQLRWGDRITGLISTRIAQAENSRALRVIDFCGEADALAQSGQAILNLMQTQKLEYADLWEFGLAPEVLTKAGFYRLKSGDSVIVPNFFEPFVQENKKIEFAVKGFEELNYVIFRGDGDQDRPNRLLP